MLFAQASYKKRTQIHPGATIVPAGLKVVLLYKLFIKSLHKSTQRVQLSSRAQTSAFVQASYKKPTQIHPEGAIVPAGLKLMLLYKLFIKSLHKFTQSLKLGQQGSNECFCTSCV